MGEVVDVKPGYARNYLLPQGKALDLYEGTPIINSDCKLIGTNDYADMDGADVCIVTAGVPRKPGMSRDDLLEVNKKIMEAVAPNVKKYAPNAFVIVVANPLDIMVHLMKKITGFPKNRVVGMAGMLDASRFSSFISMETGLSVKDIHTIVLGGHGDTMVPMPRYANINGIPLSHFLSEEKIEAIVARTRKAGGEIVGLLKTGSAFYSPAEAAVEMAACYLRDSKRVQPCAAYLEGEYGIDKLYIGVPVKLGSKGIEQIVEIKLTAEEDAALKKSADAVQGLVETLAKLG